MMKRNLLLYPNQLIDQTKKSRKKLHHHKTQPIFSEASQTKCRKPFDFPTRISSFPK